MFFIFHCSLSDSRAYCDSRLLSNSILQPSSVGDCTAASVVNDGEFRVHTMGTVTFNEGSRIVCSFALNFVVGFVATPATFLSPTFRGGEKGFRLINGGRTSSGALRSFKAIKGEHSTNDLE